MRNRLSVPFFLLLALSACKASAGHYVVEPDSSIDIGFGFDPLNPEEARDQILDPALSDPKNQLGVDSNRFELVILESDEDHQKLHSKAANLSARYMSYRGSFSGAYAEGFTSGEHRISWAIVFEVNFSRHRIRQAEINAKRESFKDWTPSDFRDQYGSEIVLEAAKGARLIAKFSAYAANKENIKSIRASLQAGFTSGLNSVSGQAAYGNFLKDAAGKSEIRFSIETVGGAPFGSVPDSSDSRGYKEGSQISSGNLSTASQSESLWKDVQNALALMRDPRNQRTVRVWTMNYLTFLGKNTVDTSKADTAFHQTLKRARRASTQLNRVTAILDIKTRGTDYTYLPDEDVQALQRLEEDLTNDKELIEDRLRQLATTGTSTIPLPVERRFDLPEVEIIVIGNPNVEVKVLINHVKLIDLSQVRMHIFVDSSPNNTKDGVPPYNPSVAVRFETLMHEGKERVAAVMGSHPNWLGQKIVIRVFDLKGRKITDRQILG